MYNAYTDDVNKINSELNDAIQKRNQAADTLNKQNENYHKKISDMAKDTDHIHDQIHSAEAELQRLRHELSLITPSLVPKQHQLSEIERKQNIEDDAHARLAEEAKTITNRLESEKKANQALQKQADNFRNEIAQLDLSLKQTDDNTKMYNDKLNKSQDNLNDTDNQIRDINLSIAKINREILNNEELLDRLDPEFQNIDSLVESLTLNYQKLNKRRLDLEKENAAEAQKVKTLEDQIAKTVENIRHNEAKIPELYANKARIWNDIRAEEAKRDHITDIRNQEKSKTSYLEPDYKDLKTQYDSVFVKKAK